MSLSQVCWRGVLYFSCNGSWDCHPAFLERLKAGPGCQMVQGSLFFSSKVTQTTFKGVRGQGEQPLGCLRRGSTQGARINCNSWQGSRADSKILHWARWSLSLSCDTWRIIHIFCGQGGSFSGWSGLHSWGRSSRRLAGPISLCILIL